MRLPERDLQLTYCTNIHPSGDLAGVLRDLDRYAVPLRARLAPDEAFGLGLRLSGEESRELLAPGQLAAFRAFLEARGLYVFTMNGFPYGPFHGQAVKAQVHAPDWLDPERVAYTERLIEILAALLPAGLEGGISSSPLSYKAWVDARDPAVWDVLTDHVTQVAVVLARRHAETGQLMHLDLEPEPDGLLERSDELARFFTEHLLTRGARSLAAQLGVTLDAAQEAMRRHVQVCFDTCHVAVAREVPAEALARYHAAGLRIGRVQISSALRLPLPPDPEARRQATEALRPYAESTYLHQVIARRADGGLTQFPDLPEALAHLADPALTEARVHFHVPVFAQHFGDAALASTQAEILQTFAALRETPFTGHLEIETYTWDVLPADLKLPLVDMVEREYRWVQHVL